MLSEFEEIQFWTLQSKEHCIFIVWGLAPDQHALKDTALTLIRVWETHRETRDKNKILTIIQAMRTFLDNVTRKQSKEWIGFLYPAFIQHMKEENDYFERKITSSLSEKDELLFWTLHEQEATSLVGHLTDPSESKFTVDALKLSEHFRQLHHHAKSASLKDYQFLVQQTLQSINASLKAGRSMLKTGKPKNIVPALLAIHESREEEYAKKVLENRHLKMMHMKP